MKQVARAMSEPWQHFLQSQRLKLSYWTWGDAAKPPLILVHGGRDHARSWDFVAERLTDRYHVVACDLRGHGDSEWSRGSHYGTPEHVLDLIALIDLVGGRASVVGHSFGGAITLLAASAFPDHFERVVSIEGAGAWASNDVITPDQFRTWAKQSRGTEGRSPRVYPSIEEARDRMREANPRLSSEMAMHLARWGTHGIDGGYVWKFDPWLYARAELHNLRFEEIEGLWRDLKAPVLHLSGSESHFNRSAVNGRPVESYFSDASAVTIDGAGHWAHHDQLDATAASIRGFLG
jgi:pimeloyl-ACP methyl ester carboxylesterase